MSHFHLIDRDIDFLLPPSVQEWLPEGHLARYVVEAVFGIVKSVMGFRQFLTRGLKNVQGE